MARKVWQPEPNRWVVIMDDGTLVDVHRSSNGNLSFHHSGGDLDAKKLGKWLKDEGHIPVVEFVSLEDNTYLTSYCNHVHCLSNGAPIDHECFMLPVEALEAERRGDCVEASNIISDSTLHRHAGMILMTDEEGLQKFRLRTKVPQQAM